MKILDKYILKKILTTFFFVVLIIVAIIVVIDITEKMDKFSENNLSKVVILGYYMDFIPWIAGLIAPITVFIAIVYVTSRMAGQTEIIAILSSGVSFKRFLLPYFFGAMLIASMSFVFNGWLIPKSNRSRLSFETQYFNRNNYFSTRNLHLQLEPDVYLYIQSYNNQTNIGFQFTLEKFKNNELLEKLTADQIQWDSTKMKWSLHWWKIHRVGKIFDVKNILDSGVSLTSGDKLDTTLAISPKDFENENRKYDGMTIPELQQHIDKLKFRGSTGVEAYEVEKYIRFASPFTIFVLVFMGVIVSARKNRGGTGFQIALGFFLSFIFILFFMMSRTFAEAGSLSPLIAAWIPNVVFGVISLGMYKYVPR
ncbi:MAG: LptF/LptG family permease [Bacteroidia bacterium]|nr:LptF/LptG family permease [Bacteroidia bacterium]